MLLLEIFAAWLTADLAVGLVHWWEDRYGDPAWPILGRLVVEPNIRHHTHPRAFLAGNYWKRNCSSIVPAVAVALAAAACGEWWLATVAAFASQGNEIHGWAHQRCSRFVRGLQMTGILLSPEQHADHHEQPFSVNYCTMTDLVNPVLERIRFWRGLEAVFAVVGIRPRLAREAA